jgi:hypothetical protein
LRLTFRLKFDLRLAINRESRPAASWAWPGRTRADGDTRNQSGALEGCPFIATRALAPALWASGLVGLACVSWRYGCARVLACLAAACGLGLELSALWLGECGSSYWLARGCAFGLRNGCAKGWLRVLRRDPPANREAGRRGLGVCDDERITIHLERSPSVALSALRRAKTLGEDWLKLTL